jgi:predicted Fe-Mo cluster-binding NifX family protein
MKIAIASEAKAVAQHFGHCEGFWIFTVSEGSLEKQEFVANPGHRPGFLPNYLNELGVSVIISGGMGGGAIEIFNERGIRVITGAEGDVDEVIQSFISGNLTSTDSVCQEHQHQGTCGNH